MFSDDSKNYSERASNLIKDAYDRKLISKRSINAFNKREFNSRLKIEQLEKVLNASTETKQAKISQYDSKYNIAIDNMIDSAKLIQNKNTINKAVAEINKNKYDNEQFISVAASMPNSNKSLREIVKTYIDSSQEKRNSMFRNVINKYFDNIETKNTLNKRKFKHHNNLSLNAVTKNNISEDDIKEKIEKYAKTVTRSERSAVKGAFKIYQLDFHSIGQTNAMIKEFVIENTVTLVKDITKKHYGSKIAIVLDCTYYRKESNEYADKMIRSRQDIIDNNYSYIEQINEIYSQIDDNKVKLGKSGFVLIAVNNVKIEVSNVKIIKGSGFVKLPDFVINSKSCVNIQNDDDLCALWCLAIDTYLDKIESGDEPPVTKYSYLKPFKPYLDKLKNDCKDIQFPLATKDICKLEKIVNKRINVLTIDNDKIVHHTMSKNKYNIPTVNLLLYKNHYNLVLNLSRLLSKQSNIDSYRKNFVCDRCMQSMTTEKALIEHLKKCSNYDHQIIQMPKPGDSVEFNKYEMRNKLRWVIYADFESTLVENTNIDNTLKTQKTHTHVPVSYCFNIVDRHTNTNRLFTYFKKDDNDCVITHFLQTMIKETADIVRQLNTIIPMDCNPADVNSATCRYCMKIVTENNEVLDESRTNRINKVNTHIVRDHCHLTGQFRGYACNSCNLNAKQSKYIPVFFHNLKGYDAHLLMKYMGHLDLNGENSRDSRDRKIKVIATNQEKYISFTLMNTYRFVDSCAHIPASLEDLTISLKKSGHDKFIMTKRYFGENYTLFLEKGVYPYNYCKSLEDYNRTKLINQADFYDKMTNQPCSNSDYSHYKNVYNKMCSNFKDYTLLYNISDVLLLSDIYENHVNMCMQYYKLDPSHSYTSPGYSWSAFLSQKQHKIELLSDINMDLDFRSILRGGVSVISHRFAQANNKYMTNYNPKKESSFIIPTDCVNLYGFCMAQKLPYADYHYEENLDLDYWMDVIKNSNETDSIGYVLFVDLDYPDNLHELHNDYPLCAENLDVNKFEKSSYQKGLIEKFNIKPLNNNRKLCPNLCNKKNYGCYINNLKYYLEKGLVLKEVHKVISFKQDYIMKSYIDFNTSKRAAATNDVSKNLFKLMVNSAYGKSMESKRNRLNFNIFTTSDNSKTLNKYFNKPTYESSVIFNENCIGVKCKTESVKLDTPLAIGAIVLEHSKLCMYKFHYDVIKKLYGDRATLIATDTDSLKYHIKTEDFYADIKNNNLQDYFDFSGFDKTHSLYSVKNKKVPGKFADESNGKPIISFCGLRAKLYSELSENSNKNVGKGIKRYLLKKDITHSDYKRCLFNSVTMSHKMNGFKSKLHEISSICQEKVSLCPYDDKRWICENGIHTYALGHYKTKL